MKITKYNHSCFYLEKDGRGLLFDPVEYTDELPAFDNIDAVVVTHLHGDHFQPEVLASVRAVFYDAEKKMVKIGARVRVRDESDRVTMSYKQTADDSLTGTKEICLVVDDYDKAVDFLKQIGMVQKSTEETRRESWTLDGAEIELDEWPWLPAFVEVETENEADMGKIADKLGLKMSEAMHGSVDIVYEKYYAVTCDEVNAWPEIRFGAVPEWLERKRRKI
ncbi:MAG: MBL fold metallo-hydrolase [Candidatus Nomurabacteria bacterium]|jgi:adenylate cyclase class 2|nr:MBL fold metallo-hydrolase [Candidatus Nomurabacteria bacterium]